MKKNLLIAITYFLTGIANADTSKWDNVINLRNIEYDKKNKENIGKIQKELNLVGNPTNSGFGLPIFFFTSNQKYKKPLIECLKEKANLEKLESYKKDKDGCLENYISLIKDFEHARKNYKELLNKIQTELENKQKIVVETEKQIPNPYNLSVLKDKIANGEDYYLENETHYLWELLVNDTKLNQTYKGYKLLSQTINQENNKFSVFCKYKEQYETSNLAFNRKSSPLFQKQLVENCEKSEKLGIEVSKEVDRIKEKLVSDYKIVSDDFKQYYNTTFLKILPEKTPTDLNEESKKESMNDENETDETIIPLETMLKNEIQPLLDT